MSLLHLMHLVSPALPIGAYAYSQGLEYAIEAGWLQAPGALEDWLKGLLHHAIAKTDAPMMHQCLLACQQQDVETFNRHNNYLLALRETAELYLEDTQLGLALQRLLNALGVPPIAVITPCFAGQFARAAQAWNIDADAALQGFMLAWLENQIAAATKLVPLGQTHAQQLLIKLMGDIPALAQAAQQLTADEIGWSLPGLVQASQLHERQYSRLFRS